MDQPLIGFPSLLHPSSIIKYFPGHWQVYVPPKCLSEADTDQSCQVSKQRGRGTALMLQDWLWHVLHLKLCSPPQQHLHQMCFDRALCSTWWGQGGKVTRVNCLVTRHMLSPDYEGRVKGSLELNPLCLIGGGVMWSWYAPERHPALKLWHAVTSLTCWLLGCWKRLAHVWNCWHSLTLTQGKDEKNFIPIRVDCGFLTSMVSVQMGRLIM